MRKVWDFVWHTMNVRKSVAKENRNIALIKFNALHTDVSHTPKIGRAARWTNAREQIMNREQRKTERETREKKKNDKL